MVRLKLIGNIAFHVYADDHRPAHFHVVAPDFKAMIAIDDLSVIRGAIPARDRRTVEAWAAENRDAVKAAWNRLNPDKPV